MQVKSKIALTVSAVFLVCAGIALDFLPQEIGTALGTGSTSAAVLPFQLLAAAYLGVGFMNWYSKQNKMGGIYSRPLALQNLLLFGVAAIGLDRAAVHGTATGWIQLAAIVFTLFALAFCWLIFFHDPIGQAQTEGR
jgi:hypothetical protein